MRLEGERRVRKNEIEEERSFGASELGTDRWIGRLGNATQQQETTLTIQSDVNK